jgi:hypothetical protein
MDSIEEDLKRDEGKPLLHDIMNSPVSLGAVQVCLDHSRVHQRSRKVDPSLEGLGALLQERPLSRLESQGLNDEANSGMGKTHSTCLG